jgi:serine/threonine protein kinase
MQINTVLKNRYKITGILSKTGQGPVYQARDMHFPHVMRLVALKEMRADSVDPATRESMIIRFIAHVRLWESLQHPAIPLIYDHFAEKGRAYLVMQYINGRDLEFIVKSVTEFLPIEMVCKWAIQLCDALQYLHTHEPPLIFGVLEPSNIMIDVPGDAKLVDFGMARIFQSKPAVNFDAYASPEWVEHGKITAASDIYSLGASLHHALTRRDPRSDLPSTFSEHPIRSLNPKASLDLEAIVTRALLHKPQQRFSSALAMKEALQQCLEGMA